MNFLIFGGPGIGDTIFELTFAKALMMEYPNSHVDLMVSDALNSAEAVLDVLKCQDYIENCWVYSRKHPFQLAALLLRLRLKKYGYGFSCASAFKANSFPSRMCRLIGCKSVIKQSGKKTSRIDYPIQAEENIHFVLQYEKLLKALHSNRKLDIEVLNPKKIHSSIRIKHPDKMLLTLCIGTNITIFKNLEGKNVAKNIKEWSNQKWTNLAVLLLENGYDVAMIGGKKDKEEIEKLLSLQPNLKNRTWNFVGKTSIQESLSILYQSDLAVGADTGFMHCAAALGKPTISLFGGTDPNVWRPFGEKAQVIWNKNECAPCYGTWKVPQCKCRKCMDSITVECVYRVIQNCFC